MTVSISRSSALAAFGFALMGGAALAKPADPAPARAAVIQALSDCRKITDDTARLTCYDNAAGALDQAESKGQVVVIDQVQANVVRRQAFGFQLPSLNIFMKGPARTGEGLDHLSLEISSAHHDANGKWVFVSSDGAVWRQTDDNELSEDPHQGSKLLIKNGVLGSFFCKIDGQQQVRCSRVS